MYAVDKNDLDGCFGRTAVQVDWPQGLSEMEKKVIRYFDDTAVLFLYRGQYVVTDEALWLTSCDGPVCGGPRAVCSSMDEVREWLRDIASEMEEDPLAGWAEA